MLLLLYRHQVTFLLARAPLARALLVCALFLTAVTGARELLAQRERVVTMKSTLQYTGKIVNVSEISEQTGDLNPTAVKQIVFIDNGLTRTFVNRQRIQPPIVNADRTEFSKSIWQRVYDGPPGASAFAGATSFTEQGHRILSVRDKFGLSQFVQGITKITPRYVELEALIGGASGKSRSWNMQVAIGAVPSPILRSVLENSIEDRERLTPFLEIVDFFIQAGRYQDADDQLRRIQILFPDEKDRVEENRIRVRQEFAKQQLREIKLMLESGQTRLATLWMKSINRDGVEGETLAELDFLLEEIEKQKTGTAKVKGVVKDLLARFGKLPDGQLSEPQKETLKRFEQEIETDLNASNIARLDSFERLANDASVTDQQSVALAISGWILGSSNAIDNWAIAQSLLQVRDLVREYLLSNQAAQREKILSQLEQFESSDPSFIASLIAQMKPLKHELIGDYDGRQPIEFSVSVEGTKADPQPRRYRCLAHLPNHYSPYRRYRLMLSLPGATSIEDQLDHFCGKFNERLGVLHGNASRNGAIVVVIDWRTENQTAAEYSAREHKIVMRALRESLRRFSVDTDQVFLQGHGVGADVAYDVGLSHPEHWAGIIGISATGIQKYPLIYSDNQARSLGIYAVVGSKYIGGIRNCKDAWNNWLRTQTLHDCTVVQYKGRLDERFAENVPDMFDWLRVQRRRYPDGSKFEFSCKSIRPWDNYFWFVELQGFPEKNTTWPALFKPKGIRALEINGQQRGINSNTFVVGPKTAGSGMTLWLSPSYFDFSREIVINGRGSFKGSVRPSRRVLLEDARQRVDFQRPYWAKVQCFGKTWAVPQ
jgi:pimeloyl-ACP methyl ester carboxylesterase